MNSRVAPRIRQAAGLCLHGATRKLDTVNVNRSRKCTGALVDVQPFGGFNMSGTDSKAGGRDAFSPS